MTVQAACTSKRAISFPSGLFPDKPNEQEPHAPTAPLIQPPKKAAAPVVVVQYADDHWFPSTPAGGELTQSISYGAGQVRFEDVVAAITSRYRSDTETFNTTHIGCSELFPVPVEYDEPFVEDTQFDSFALLTNVGMSVGKIDLSSCTSTPSDLFAVRPDED